MAKSRWIITAVMMTLLMAGTTAFFALYREEDNTAPHLTRYVKDQQQDDAENIVSGLNTHDVAKVDVIRGLSKTDPKSVDAARAQNDTVLSALPATGCQYSIKSVDDKGEQGTKIVPGLIKESRVYRLDLNVEEQCSGKPPQPRTLGLHLIPYWGYWTPLSFTS